MSRRSNWPPKPIWRFIAALRAGALDSPYPQNLDPHTKSIIRGKRRLSRSDVADIANQLIYIERKGGPNCSVRQEDIETIETSGEYNNQKVYWALRGCLLSDTEANGLMAEPGFTKGVESRDGTNGHLIYSDLRRRMALAEFGPMMKSALSYRGLQTTWVDVATSGSGGFKGAELSLSVAKTSKCIRPDDIAARA